MQLRNAIGIDPDSIGFVCSNVRIGQKAVIRKKYSANNQGIGSFVRWVKNEGDIIIGIEGGNGQSKPIEEALRKEGIIFYTFAPGDVAYFRKAVLGQHKNNDKDAESVAEYAMALESQGKLDKYKRVWFPDDAIQGLTRSYGQKSKMMTKEINGLWKQLRIASTDLYLALGGNNPDIDIKSNILANYGILSLIAHKPDIYEWKNLSESDFFEAMGSRNYKGCYKVINELQKVSKVFKPISPAMILMLKNAVMQILLLRQQLHELVNLLKVITEENKYVQTLESYRGISTLTASNLIAEIIDIRRFVKDDDLASYAGLVKREYKTGNNEAMKYNSGFNHRLKDTFMTAARNFVQYNKDSHLTGFYNNLIKGGMPLTEARKRVARALVRVIFKKLYSIVEEEIISNGIEEKIQSGSEMARGSSLRDKIYPSNISLPSKNKLNHENTVYVKKIKNLDSIGVLSNYD